MQGIVEKFLESIGEQELYPTMYNWSPFILGNGYNTKKYFSKFYKEPINFGILFLARGKECNAFVPLPPRKITAQDFFKRYWNNPETLDSRVEEFDNLTHEVDEIYAKLSNDYIQKKPISKILSELQKIVDLAWYANASVFFSLHFDKEFCLEMLQTVGSSITQTRLNEFFDQAIIPICDSFEKRHKNYVLGLLAKGLSWKVIADLCQNFTATYFSVSSVEETQKMLQEQYAQYSNSATNEQTAASKELEKRLSNHEAFTSKLNNEERKLVHYIQEIIELRDIRKDVTAKSFTIIFRVGQRLFKEAAIPEGYWKYITLSDILKGLEYLVTNKAKLMKRSQGFSLLIPHSGEMIIEYGDFDDNMNKLSQIQLAQHKAKQKTNEITGQIACKGKVKGIVKIIRNSDEIAKFSKGEILVTGMTRPEYVPIMAKAIAIIADEGGVTSHTAIIARELGIPCIVGTKVATKLLKDGDLIEVDAEKGIIKKLN